jgi:hypothetical protein
MNPKTLAFVSGCVGVALGAAAVWFGTSVGGASGDRRISAVNDMPKTVGAGSTTLLPSASVLQIRPNVAVAPAAHATTTVTRVQPPESALKLAYKNATDYKTILSMIDALAGDAEALRIKAEILEACTEISDDAFVASLAPEVVAIMNEEQERSSKASAIFFEKMQQKNATRDRRKEFIDSLPESHPDTVLRIAAFDRLQPKRADPSNTATKNPFESLGKNKMTRAERASL